MIWVMACRMGLCLSVGEVIVGGGELGMDGVEVEGVKLPPVPNTERITTSSIRRTSAVLSTWLGI